MSNLIAELRAVAHELRINTRAVAGQSALTVELIESVERADDTAKETNLLLAEILKRLSQAPDPGPITLFITSQEDGMLIFKIQLPAEPDDSSDIASGELTVTIAANEPQIIPTTKGQTEVPDLKGAAGDLVSATFVYVDGSGNRSVHPSSLNGVQLTDTIPPPDAGALGILVTGQDGS